MPGERWAKQIKKMPKNCLIANDIDVFICDFVFFAIALQLISQQQNKQLNLTLNAM